MLARPDIWLHRSEGLALTTPRPCLLRRQKLPHRATSPLGSPRDVPPHAKIRSVPQIVDAPKSDCRPGRPDPTAAPALGHRRSRMADLQCTVIDVRVQSGTTFHILAFHHRNGNAVDDGCVHVSCATCDVRLAPTPADNPGLLTQRLKNHRKSRPHLAAEAQGAPDSRNAPDGPDAPDSRDAPDAAEAPAAAAPAAAAPAAAVVAAEARAPRRLKKCRPHRARPFGAGLERQHGRRASPTADERLRSYEEKSRVSPTASFLFRVQKKRDLRLANAEPRRC